MDWLLSITTIGANAYLGLSTGSRLSWILHGLNAFAWIVYAMIIGQHGLILLSAATIVIDAYALVTHDRRIRLREERIIKALVDLYAVTHGPRNEA